MPIGRRRSALKTAKNTNFLESAVSPAKEDNVGSIRQNVRPNDVAIWRGIMDKILIDMYMVNVRRIVPGIIQNRIR